MPFVTAESLEAALEALWGTANHLLKIWFVLKQMGMTPGGPTVQVTTSSPTPALTRLFSYGDPEGRFYVPFAHTERFARMQYDAARSIVQTTIRRWEDSGSVVTCDPSGYLDFSEGSEGELLVQTGRQYPLGLGHGPNGFALEEGKRVAIPTCAFAVWYGRQTEIPQEQDPSNFLLSDMLRSLNIVPAEFEALFVRDSLHPTTQAKALSDSEVFAGVSRFLSGSSRRTVVLVDESFAQHTRRIKSMMTQPDGPQWLRVDPESRLKAILDAGAKAVLLYGPPRTGKTRAIDRLVSRSDPSRMTIQIHDGWGYDELMVGLRPDRDTGDWRWFPGELLKAIRDGKTFIVLEEVNRTQLTQAMGEAFFLLEEAYRGSDNQVRLRNGDDFFIPSDVTILTTMNTLDKSTEQVDDAFIGRVSAIEFPPRVEALAMMLDSACVSDDASRKVRELFATILDYYPLGHGYFADFASDTDPVAFYLAKIRPVLQYHFEGYRDAELRNIDNTVDQLWS